MGAYARHLQPFRPSPPVELDSRHLGLNSLNKQQKISQIVGRVGRGCCSTSPPIHATSLHSTTCYTRSRLLCRPRMPPLPRPKNLPKKRARTLGATQCTENTLLGKPNQLPMYIVAPGYRAAARTARVPDPLPAQKRPIIQRARYRATNEVAGHPSHGEDTSAFGNAPHATRHPPHAAHHGDPAVPPSAGRTTALLLCGSWAA
jgi:hypothetical protein